MQQSAHKAVAAALSAAVSLAALFVPGVERIVAPELIMALATILSPVLVYWVPNRPVSQ